MPRASFRRNIPRPQVFREQGISLVIWANHLTLSIDSNAEAAELIHSSESLFMSRTWSRR
jgi:hypothetical protein